VFVSDSMDSGHVPLLRSKLKLQLGNNKDSFGSTGAKRARTTLLAGSHVLVWPAEGA